MAQNTSPYSNDPGRVDSVRVARRQLLTARTTAEQPPPRVVLHLPDLNALDGVVLGPPKPITHRRFDSAHTEDDTYPSPSRPPRDGSRTDAPSAPARTEPTLANVLRVPLGKLVPHLAKGTTLEKIGKLIILAQQPKMLFAAIVAAALQLAAVLTMFTGDGTSGDQTKSPADDHHDHEHVVVLSNSHPSGVAPTSDTGGQIRTPASIGFANPSTPATSGNVAGPTLAPTLAPSLPPPQGLPGTAPGDLPWQAPGEMATSGSPTLAPPKAAGKPTRAKLVGTIKSLGTNGATP